MRAPLALLAALLSTAALAQRQPASITTIPSTTPQSFDVLDKTGIWVPFGTTSGGVFTPKDPRTVWSDDYLAVSGSDCGSLQAAYAVLQNTGGTIRLPRRKLDTGTTCQVLINGAAVDWEGQGWSESFGNGMTPSTAAPYYGSWIRRAILPMRCS